MIMVTRMTQHLGLVVLVGTIIVIVVPFLGPAPSPRGDGSADLPNVVRELREKVVRLNSDLATSGPAVVRELQRKSEETERAKGVADAARRSAEAELARFREERMLAMGRSVAGLLFVALARDLKYADYKSIMQAAHTPGPGLTTLLNGSRTGFESEFVALWGRAGKPVTPEVMEAARPLAENGDPFISQDGYDFLRASLQRK